MVVKSEPRERILHAAERLFAERGIESVSLREIGATAGQRNNSAVQYHFGTKEALIRGLYEYRLAPLNQRRCSLLDAACAGGSTPEVGTLVRAYVQPLAEVVGYSAETSWYARFVNRYVLSGQTLSRPFDEAYVGAVSEITTLLDGHLAYLPAGVRSERLRTMQLLVTSVLADLERRYADGQPPGLTHDDLVTNLVDSTVVLLTRPAPASADAAPTRTRCPARE